MFFRVFQAFTSHSEESNSMPDKQKRKTVFTKVSACFELMRNSKNQIPNNTDLQEDSTNYCKNSKPLHINGMKSHFPERPSYQQYKFYSMHKLQGFTVDYIDSQEKKKSQDM
jgi:hypothetical protein